MNKFEILTIVRMSTELGHNTIIRDIWKNVEIKQSLNSHEKNENCTLLWKYKMIQNTILHKNQS